MARKNNSTPPADDTAEQLHPGAAPLMDGQGNPVKVPVGDAAADIKTPEAPKKSNPKLPESVILAAPHGYIDDDDVNHHWHAGTVVTDAKEIADLMARKAPLEGITHED